MADTVSKTSSEPFTEQARGHRNVADHTRQWISQHQQNHDSLMEAAQASCMRDSIQSYAEWWDAFRDQLLKHADTHDNMAKSLDKAAQGFDETDNQSQQVVAMSPSY